MKKIATSFRLSPAAYDLLQKLVAVTGMPRGACLELAIRELARKQGVLDVLREAPAEEAAGPRGNHPAARDSKPGANRKVLVRTARTSRTNPRQTGARGSRIGEAQ